MGFLAGNDDDDDIILDETDILSNILDKALDHIDDLEEISLDTDALEIIGELANRQK